MNAVLDALGLAPAALWNADQDGPVVVRDGTRDVSLTAVLRAIGARQGAEIGVERGHYTEVLCKALPDATIHAVDAWAAYRGYREHVSQEKLDGFYDETRQRLQGQHVEFHRGLSVEQAAHFEAGALDFVYIDGNHTLPHVIADLAAWSPKVRSGGIIAGHDYGRSSVGHVREAVTAWTTAYRITPWFVLAGDKSPSFLWVQP